MGPVLLNTVLPAVVLTLINQLTNYFHWPDMFEAVIGNASSVLMTLAAVFISYFQSLPSSAAIRYTVYQQEGYNRESTVGRKNSQKKFIDMMDTESTVFFAQ